MLTLAGFEALQLVKLPQVWSLCLGGASIFHNTPSFHSCLDLRVFSELSETSFLCTESVLPEDGMRSGGGSGQALLCHTVWKLNINVLLLLPAWKSHSHSILTCIVVARVSLSLEMVLDSPIPHFGWLLISCNRLKHSGLTLSITRKSCLFWSNWISFPELRSLHYFFNNMEVFLRFYLIELAAK